MLTMYVCVCVSARERVGVRTCACVRERVRACVCAFVRAFVLLCWLMYIAARTILQTNKWSIVHILCCSCCDLIRPGPSFENLAIYTHTHKRTNILTHPHTPTYMRTQGHLAQKADVLTGQHNVKIQRRAYHQLYATY